MANIKESIQILKKAQELDREIYSAGQVLAAMPDERVQLKQKLESEKNHLRDLEAALKKTQLLQKEKEGSLAQKEANIKKLDGQMGQVKTNKEYSALQQEMASLRADNSMLEEEIIRFFDEVEAADSEVKKEREKLKEIEKQYAAREAELLQKEKDLAKNLEVFKKSRQEIMVQVAPDIQATYDLIIRKKHGLALVKVNGEICGACQLQLRAQLINEVRLASSLVCCENCSRILFFEE